MCQSFIEKNDFFCFHSSTYKQLENWLSIKGFVEKKTMQEKTHSKFFKGFVEKKTMQEKTHSKILWVLESLTEKSLWRKTHSQGHFPLPADIQNLVSMGYYGREKYDLEKN